MQLIVYAVTGRLVPRFREAIEAEPRGAGDVAGRTLGVHGHSERGLDELLIAR